METTMGHRFTMLFAALLLAGCASTPPAGPPADLPLPATFRGAEAVTGAPQPADGAWWRAFGDAQLDALVQRAAQRNTGVQAAAARLAAARALLRGAEAERRPQLQATAGAAREASPTTAYRPATTLSLGANLVYEVDIAGRLASARDAAVLDAAEREALLRDTQLLVQAEVVRSYFVLRALDAEAALVRRTVASYRGTLQLTERRFAAGEVPELEVARVRSELASNQSEALALDRQRAQVEHGLALLLGEPAGGFVLPAAAEPDAEPALLPQVPPGLPSAVLARRPDIAAAERALRAAQVRVEVARSAWWPQLTLTAAGGQASPELGDLLRSGARTWGLGALLALPLFDGGRREAAVDGARAGADVAVARWREQVLVALREVEDELVAVRLLGEQAAAQRDAVDAAARVSALAEVRYRNGFVSQLELLDAQRSELRSRRQALQVRAARYQATVGLMQALGGGWDGRGDLHASAGNPAIERDARP